MQDDPDESGAEQVLFKFGLSNYYYYYYFLFLKIIGKKKISNRGPNSHPNWDGCLVLYY